MGLKYWSIKLEIKFFLKNISINPSTMIGLEPKNKPQFIKKQDIKIVALFLLKI
jgi:hypothetical protein